MHLSAPAAKEAGDFIDEKLRHLLPHDEGRPAEKAAAQALCLRM